MYTEYFINFNKGITEEESDIVIALLSQTDFESFEAVEQGVKAYIKAELIDKTAIDLVIENLKGLYEFELSIQQMEDKNWNQEWEKNYEPVFINENCVIRAPFHEIKPLPEYEIIIEPKMAFGTGHHETTFLISGLLFSERIKNKEICDAGTGSGIFSILASKLRAKNVFAYDIDVWSYNNTKENLKINKINNVKVSKGDVSLIKNKKFDFILANINRNILLNDVAYFVRSLNTKGTLIVSGFYAQDLPILIKEFEKNGLKLDTFKKKNNWVAAIFRLN